MKASLAKLVFALAALAIILTASAVAEDYTVPLGDYKVSYSLTTPQDFKTIIAQGSGPSDIIVGDGLTVIEITPSVHHADYVKALNDYFTLLGSKNVNVVEGTIDGQKGATGYGENPYDGHRVWMAWYELADYTFVNVLSNDPAGSGEQFADLVKSIRVQKI
jgi:hypothetical protein